MLCPFAQTRHMQREYHSMFSLVNFVCPSCVMTPFTCFSYKNKSPEKNEGFSGAENGIRTRNIRLGKPTLYH